MLESLFIGWQAFVSPALLKGDSYTDVFCEYCEIFKNNYLEEDPRTSASVHNFRVNALHVDLIRPSLENTTSMVNLLVPLFLNFF